MTNNYRTQIVCVETNKIYRSRLDAAIQLGVSPGVFSKYFAGKLKTVRGYHWKLLDEKEDTNTDFKPHKVYCPVEHCRFKKGNRPCAFFFTYSDGTNDCPNYEKYKLAQKAQEIEELTKED